MKTRPLILVAAALMIPTLGGCVFMNEEDKDFYGKGWVHPSELDDVAPKRPAAKPVDSDYQPTTSTAASAPQSAPEWIVPEAPDNR